MKTTTEMVLVRTEKLIPYANNARTHSKKQIEKLRSSLREFGFINPVIIDRGFGIIAGHGRVEAAKAEGIEEVPCVFVDHLTEAQKKAYIIADNRMAMDAGWDEELLREEIEALGDLGFDAALTGFETGEIELLLGTDNVKEDNYNVKEQLKKEPRSKQGDIWMLGRHRLVCGDSTKPETYERLMSGETARLVVTDPPYNVNYQSAAGKIQNDSMEEDKFRSFLRDAFSAMRTAMSDGCVFYIFHADTEGAAFQDAVNGVLGKVREVLIWVKNTLVMGRQDYQWKHEPCIYGWTDGAPHFFGGGRKQSTVSEDECDIDSMETEQLRKMLHDMMDDVPTTVIRENKPLKNADHPTMKPVKLIARLVQNSSKNDDVVLDPFGGSGTTLIACEQTGRVCRTIELDERYADVIVKRYVEFTGTDEGVYLFREGTKMLYSEVFKES